MTTDQKIDKELDFIMDEVGAEKIKIEKTKIKETEVIDMDKEKFKKTKAAHKDAIAKIKAQRADLKQGIKKHQLLIKQAKIIYKFSKLKGGK